VPAAVSLVFSPPPVVENGQERPSESRPPEPANTINAINPPNTRAPGEDEINLSGRSIDAGEWAGREMRHSAPHVEPPAACQASRSGCLVVIGTFPLRRVPARIKGAGCQRLLRAVYM
jgi:hypothetical protein